MLQYAIHLERTLCPTCVSINEVLTSYPSSLYAHLQGVRQQDDTHEILANANYISRPQRITFLYI